MHVDVAILVDYIVGAAEQDSTAVGNGVVGDVIGRRV